MAAQEHRIKLCSASKNPGTRDESDITKLKLERISSPGDARPSNFIAHPSVRRTFPNVMVESIANGKKKRHPTTTIKEIYYKIFDSAAMQWVCHAVEHITLQSFFFFLLSFRANYFIPTRRRKKKWKKNILLMFRMFCLGFFTLPSRDEVKTTNKNTYKDAEKTTTATNVTSQSRNKWKHSYENHLSTKSLCILYYIFLLLFHVIVYAVNECRARARSQKLISVHWTFHYCCCTRLRFPTTAGLVESPPHRNSHFILNGFS